jgi:CBS domain-containing protein
MRPITAGDVMNPNILTVQEDMTVEELANFLIENEISGAPVEDGGGHLTGVVSVTDLALSVAKGTDLAPAQANPDFFVREWGEPLAREEIEELQFGGAEVRVSEIMTPHLYSVDAETPIPEVADTLIKSHIHRLLVTREDRAVGILTTSDLLGLLVRDPE